MKKLTIELIDTKDLKPHEETLEQHVQQLYKEILRDKAIHVPIIVDKKTRVILDGHHRFSVAKKLKLSTIPALVIDYFDDAIISVFPRRNGFVVTKELVIQAAKIGKLFPNKSTRHILHIDFFPVPHPLAQLGL